MNGVEKSLQQTLEAHPENWSVRMLLVDMMMEREGQDDAAEVICAAPGPPENDEHLEKVAGIAGEKSLTVVREYVMNNPSSAVGHETLGRLLESGGNEKQAGQHFKTASALRANSGQTSPKEAEAGQLYAAIPEPVSEFVEPLPTSAAPPPIPGQKSEKKSAEKTTAFIIAVGVHVLIAVIAALIVILPETKDEPEIIASIVGPPAKKKQEMQKKNVMKKTKRTSAASAAAAPLALLMRANAVAKIAMPEVTRTSTGPLGIGDADFGSGGFGGDGSGMGDGGTMFGNANAKGMVGTLYDMKQDSQKKPRQMGDYYGNVRGAIKKDFSDGSLGKYYRAKAKLGFTFLAIPSMDANGGPKAFQAEKEIQPRAWFVVYKGKLDVPDEGLWRFHGFFDDMLMVFVDGKVVLDASWESVERNPKVREVSKLPTYMSARPVYAGKWINLRRGAEYTIIVGERPGGLMGGTLMIERKGEKYEKRANGSPIIPLFSLSSISDSDWERVKGTGYLFARKTPIFVISRSRF